VAPAGSDAPSLRGRLLWLVLAAIALVSLLQASTAYRSALREADRMFDYHLEEVARSVNAGVPFAPGNNDPQEYSVQIWAADGTELFRAGGMPLPTQAILGFSDTVLRGVRLRIYSLQTPEHTIQIAQDLDARERRARLLAFNAVTPVLLLAPLLMLAVGWVISASISPLSRMRRQIASRPATDLSPLPQQGVPQEVLPLVRELNLLFGRVGDMLAAQRNFVADAAHELRSPLTALKLQLQSLQRTGTQGPGHAAADLEEGIERAIRLVEQLLALAREEGGDHSAQLEEVSLDEAARQVVADLYALAQQKQVDLGMAAGAQPASVRAQRDAVTLLLRNLVENAIKYTPAGGRIDVGAMRDDTGAVLRVDDSGPGIAPDERDRVFDRFYRIAGSGQSGSGLGLAIVQAVARRLGAAVTLSQAPELGGLRAEVRFPPA
jgi:two-component system OmpR family sensor kinase